MYKTKNAYSIYVYAAAMAGRNGNNTNVKSTGRKFMKSLNKHETHTLTHK